MTILIYVISQELLWPYNDAAVPCPELSGGDTAFLACAVGIAAEPFPGVPIVPAHPQSQGHGHSVPCTLSSPVLSGSLCSQAEGQGRHPAGRVPLPQGKQALGCARVCSAAYAHPAGTEHRRVWGAVRSPVILCTGVCVCTHVLMHDPVGVQGLAGDVHVCVSVFVCMC